MDNTTMPLLGILGFPITVLFGPIATFNVLIDLAIFASAMSFYVMARRFVSWWPAAFVGGLAYGFSPFTAATANAHLFLLFQAVPPLVILFVDRFLRSSESSPRVVRPRDRALLRGAVLRVDRGLRLAGRHDRHCAARRRRVRTVEARARSIAGGS